MNLITGATGHIGNVLTRTLLNQGEEVRAMVLPGEETTSLTGLDIEKMEGDVLEPASLRKALHGVGRVFHLAGIISIMPGRNPHVWKVNVEGTQNMLAAARDAGVDRFVYTSSIHALQRIEEGIIDETLAFDPNNPYGEYDRSKAAATLSVQQAAQDGLDAVIACPTGVIGPYDYRGSLMGSVIRSAALQQTTPYIDGAYDFVDVRDVSDGLVAAANQGRAGESYILSGSRITVRYLLETVREITGRAFVQFKVPFDLARFVAQIMPVYYRLAHATPRITPYSVEVLKSNSHISHAKATRELGFHPRILYDSLTDAVHWFLENRRS